MTERQRYKQTERDKGRLSKREKHYMKRVTAEKNGFTTFLYLKCKYLYADAARDNIL